VVCFDPAGLGYWGLVLILFIFASDTLDGWFARHFDKPDKSGAFFDITADRVTEVVLLVPFVFLHLVDPLLLIYYVTKDFLVDHMRMRNYIRTGNTPFEQSHNKFFVLVKSRSLRAIYGILKLLMFLVLYYRMIAPGKISVELQNAIVITTVLISLIRTIPVFLGKDPA
jgi:phosphatidylglycerophosphate synthase